MNRIVVVREFAKYLISLNNPAFVIPAKYIPKKQKYKSYIYSNIELQNIFKAIDGKQYNCYFKRTYIVLPVLFRTLYCCGLRISEVVNIKLKNVANIEKSKQSNPRVHDLRHTFAVNCFKKFVLENKELDAYLPVLKTYMGHSKFVSTEYYLKLTNDMFPDILERTNAYIKDAIPLIGGIYEE